MARARPCEVVGGTETSSNERMNMSTQLHTDRIVKDLKTVARDAEDLVRATAGEVGEKAREARSRLSAAVESAKASCERIEEKAIAGAQATDKAIREYPYQSIGVAFGIGLLIGVLVNRRNDRS